MGYSKDNVVSKRILNRTERRRDDKARVGTDVQSMIPGLINNT